MFPRYNRAVDLAPKSDIHRCNVVSSTSIAASLTSEIISGRPISLSDIDLSEYLHQIVYIILHLRFSAYLMRLSIVSETPIGWTRDATFKIIFFEFP